MNPWAAAGLAAWCGVLLACAAPPDERLWKLVLEPLGPPAQGQTYEDWLKEAEALQRRRLTRLADYLRMYPGGAHAEAAIALELRTLFELGTLAGGDLGPLCARVRERLDQPRSDAIRCEAAYWAWLCRRLASAPPTSQPSNVPVLPVDDDMLREYEGYLADCPDSPHAPRMVAVLADQALRAGRTARVRELVDLLRDRFPGHPFGEQYEAELRRREALGRPFRARFQLEPGRDLDTALWAGKVGAILVWSSHEPRSAAVLRELETLRSTRQDLELAGVCLDEEAATMRATLAAAGANWPQVHDGLGRAGEFARTWAVWHTPQLFVLDRRGVLSAIFDLKAEPGSLAERLPP